MLGTQETPNVCGVASPLSRCLDGAGLSPHCPLLFPGWPATFLSLLSPPRLAVSPSLPSSGTGRLQTSLCQPTWRQASPGRLSVSSLLHRPRASVPKRWFICAEPHLPLVRVSPGMSAARREPHQASFAVFNHSVLASQGLRAQAPLPLATWTA